MDEQNKQNNVVVIQYNSSTLKACCEMLVRKAVVFSINYYKEMSFLNKFFEIKFFTIFWKIVAKVQKNNYL